MTFSALRGVDKVSYVSSYGGIPWEIRRQVEEMTELRQSLRIL